MKILLVTEKYDPEEGKRDGGARLVNTIISSFGESIEVMQFGSNIEYLSKWRFNYPYNLANRFENRLANAEFIIEKVKSVEEDFTHIIFIHISMQFGLTSMPLREDITVWTFPMFLTPSYLASGEVVPEKYYKAEYATLKRSKNIITPSYLEKDQLIETYAVPPEQIHVIPRGVDNKYLNHKIRHFEGSLKICSVGTIKPQKNTIGLIDLFVKIRSKYSSAKLKIIGPVQNTDYFDRLRDHIDNLEIGSDIEFSGYVSPIKFCQIIEDCHIHLSASTCETFGRAIFETLACGLPNIAKRTGNAAARFLSNLPYVSFVDNNDDALNSVENMILNLPRLSSMASEVGILYDDKFLSKLLVAKIIKEKSIGISDFDGTLFHKDDIEMTDKCIRNFQEFSVKVVCSARSSEFLINELIGYNLRVDWIISFGGAVAMKGDGEVIWVIPLSMEDVVEIESIMPTARRIMFESHVVQMAVPAKSMLNLPRLRIEIYQDTAFIFSWQASKLRSIQRLLQEINWSGQVQAFGDGMYDMEFLNYFDGKLITSEHGENIIRRTNNV